MNHEFKDFKTAIHYAIDNALSFEDKCQYWNSFSRLDKWLEAHNPTIEQSKKEIERELKKEGKAL